MTWLAAGWGWVKTHKSLAAIAAALVVGFFAGTRYAQKPSVHEVVADHVATQAQAKTDTTTTTQSEKITITDFDTSRYHVGDPVEALQPSSPAAGRPTDFCRPIVVPGEDRIIRQTVIERGPSTTETHAQAEEHQVEDHRLELTVTPSTSAQWALQAGFEDVLHAKTLRLAARRRLFGPFWAELSGVPAQRSLGVAVAGEF